MRLFVFVVLLVAAVKAGFVQNWHAESADIFQTCAASSDGYIVLGQAGTKNEVQGFGKDSGKAKWSWSPPGGASLYTEVVVPKAVGSPIFVLDIMQQNNNITLDISRIAVATGEAAWTVQMANTSGGATTTLATSHGGETVAAIVAELTDGESKVKDCKLYVYDGTQKDPEKALIGTYVAKDVTKYPASCNVVAVSSDGGYAAMYASQQITVWDVKAKKVRWTSPPLGYSEQDLAISTSGEFVSVGFTSLAVYQWNKAKGTYDLFIGEDDDATFILGKQAFSADGKTLVVGRYAATFAQNRIDVYFMNSTKLAWTYAYPEEDQKDQDIVSSVAVSADGRTFVIGSWGNGTPDGAPTINVFSTATSDGPVASFHTPGSVNGVDLAMDGTVCVAAKHEHSNEMGSGGDGYSFSITA